MEAIPEFPLALNNLGNLEMDLGDLDGAESHYKQALEVHEKDLNGDFNLGRLYWKKGDREAALRHFNAMVEKRPDNELLYKAADLLVDAAEADAAIHLYETALQSMPGLTAARFRLAALLFAQNQDKETALKHLEQVKLQDPGFPGLTELMDDIRAKL